MHVTFNAKAAVLTVVLFAAIAISEWLGVPSSVAFAALLLITAFEVVSFFGSHNGGRQWGQ